MNLDAGTVDTIAVPSTALACVTTMADRAAELGAQFRALLLGTQAKARALFADYVELGRIAYVAKEHHVPHGQWENYCLTELGISASTALDYRKIYLGRDLLQPGTDSIRAAVAQLTQPKSGARPRSETRTPPCQPCEHEHWLSLRWCMAPYSVLNTRNSAAWVLRAKAYADRLGRVDNDGAEAALAELQARWFCPMRGLVLDAQGMFERGIAVGRARRSYCGLHVAEALALKYAKRAKKLIAPQHVEPAWCYDDAAPIPEADLLIARVDRDNAGDAAALVGKLRLDRFACVIASDALAVARAIDAFTHAGAEYVSDAVLLSPTPARNVEPFQQRRIFNPAHRHLMLFAKGSAEAAAAACPPLTDADVTEYANVRGEKRNRAETAHWFLTEDEFDKLHKPKLPRNKIKPGKEAAARA
jgi:hypothetical protein